MQTIQPSLAENRVILDPVSWETFNQLLLVPNKFVSIVK